MKQVIPVCNTKRFILIDPAVWVRFVLMLSILVLTATVSHAESEEPPPPKSFEQVRGEAFQMPPEQVGLELPRFRRQVQACGLGNTQVL